MSSSSILSPSRWSWKRVILVIYLAFLAGSHLVRLTDPDHVPRFDQQTITVLEVENDEPGDRVITIAYVDSDPAPIRARPTVVLLHGSPVASSSMMGLHNALNRTGKYRVITPDLPGFAGSTFPISDYSVRSHALYVNQMLDSLGIEEAHFVAYSMSGGVVIENSRISPHRQKSTTLLSAIGVQELELTGFYHLNHAVHGLQLGFLWLIQEGFPHFGWMDNAILNTGYARNFYDTDQRPLRGALQSLNHPVQIIHGRDDPLVPYRAAEEHRRIVPQSELVSFDVGGHGLAFSSADTVGRLIEQFLDKVEDGTALTRASASPDRVSEAEPPFDMTSQPPATGSGLIVLCFFIVITTLVSEDLACIGAGLLAASGTIPFSVAVGASFGGIVFGDVLIYVAGRTLGYKAASRAPLKWFFSKDRLERGEHWFQKHGMKLIFTSRFIPGTRFATYFSAGVMRAPIRIFLFYFFIAAAIWTPILVGLATLVGAEFWEYYALFESYALWGFLGLLLALFIVFHIIPQTFTYRGRKLLVSWWYRITRWEFWPLPVFYTPIVFYCLWLGIRFRSLTIFTAANPGIWLGGFVGESKTEILAALDSSGNVPAFLEIAGSEPLATDDTVLPPESHHLEATHTVEMFMKDQGLSFPIVLKPVTGERGKDVVIARSREMIVDYFFQHQSATIAQKYASGKEFGVFYVRRPEEETGYIFSITEKNMMRVTGDGMRSLERLILDDERALCMAPLHLSNFDHKLDQVLADGERFSLVDIGTHSRGAIFTDATGNASEKFKTSIEEIAQSFHGFYFGRFDIRVDSDNPLGEPENIQIIELNGVTSEATHIYDPKHSLFYAYRTLFQQWRLAFEIGRENARRGAQVPSVRTIVSTLISNFGNS